MVTTRHIHPAASAAALLFLVLPASPASAQCETTWLAGPDQGVAGVDGAVHAMTRWDPDGAGPLSDWLIIGGRFTIAGDTAANNIVAWDGERFHRLGGGFDSAGQNGVTALTVYNGDLIAGGQLYRAEGQVIPGVAAWDGVSWRSISEAGEPVGSIGGGEISALTVYDGDLIAGGRFGAINHTSAQNIARWDGASWSAFSPGLAGEVKALLVHDGELLAGGFFPSADGMSFHSVARWNSTGWDPLLGDHFVQDVLSLTEYNGLLIAGTRAGALRWTGQDWEPFGDNWHGRAVYAMLVYAGGLITTGSDLMILNGGTWELFGNTGPGQAAGIFALGSLGDEVLVGGGFTQARSVRSRGLIRYTPANGGAWLAFGSGFDGYIDRAAVWTGQLVVAGAFRWIGDVEAYGIARWDGDAWHTLPAGRAFAARAMLEHDGDLYLGGVANPHDSRSAGGLARFDGDQWTTLLTATPGAVNSLLSTPDGLIVAGDFPSAGSVPAANIARLDATNGWHALGSGLDASVQALALYDGDIFAAGAFTTSGTTLLNKIARWDGVSWQPVGDFPGGTVRSLAVYDGELVVGGSLFFEDTRPVMAAAWNNQTWRPLGSPSGEYIRNLAVYNNRLFSIWSHDSFGPLPNRVISEWNGSTWTFPDDQFNALANDLTICNGELIAVGRFTQVGDLGSAYWARYGFSPSSLCPADTDCDSAVTPFDLVTYVNLWFADDPSAERTDDIPARIDVFDLLAYLDEWFTGC